MPREFATRLMRQGSRDDAFDLLELYSASAKEELGLRRLQRDLIKSYLVEVDRDERPVADLLAPNLRLAPVGDDLYQVFRRDTFVGFAEDLGGRIITLYTIVGSSSADLVVERLLRDIPQLDATWLSGTFLTEVFQAWVSPQDPQRYIRMRFDSADLADFPDVPTRLTFGDDREDDVAADAAEKQKGAVVTFAARLQTINKTLPLLAQALPTFFDPTTLRIPAVQGEGGHDVYAYGKVTNRSSSFREHRQRLLDLTHAYTQLVDTIEGLVKATNDNRSKETAPVALPVLMQFPALSEHQLERLVRAMMRKTGPFRLWGQEIRRGPTRFELHAIDLHMWQLLDFELGADYLYMTCRDGVCGNVVNRFMTNLQRYVSPSTTCLVGQVPYADLVRATLGVDA